MNIFVQIKDAFYSPSFYEQKKTAPGKTAFAYYFKLILIVTVIATIIVSLYAIPFITKTLSKNTIEGAIALFPAELTVTIKNGVASSTVKEPYYIAVPESWRSVMSSTKPNLMVIDTKDVFAPAEFEAYGTNAVLSKDYLAFRKSTGELQIESLKSLPDTTVNQDQLREWAANIYPLLKFVIPFLAIGIFVGFFLFFAVGNLIFLVIISLVTWAVEAIRKSGLGYGACFKLGLYAITIPIVLSLVALIFGIPIPWYLQVVIYLLCFYVNVRKKQAV